MAEWKVAMYETVVLEHPNADSLEVLKLGGFQCVVQKGTFVTGQRLLFAPEKSVLPDELAEPFRKYLAGPNKDRVKSVRLRGEFSEGVILDLNDTQLEQVASADLGADVSSLLGIVKYEPPIPANLAGAVAPIANAAQFRQHDVERFRLYENEFVAGEEIIVTEKLHGSQGVYFRQADGTRVVTSKGLAGRELGILEDVNNVYWRAAHAVGLFDHLDALEPSVSVQVFAEVLNVQKGFSYGQTQPSLCVYRVLWDGMDLEFDAVDEFFKNLWVPIVFRGAYDKTQLEAFAVGDETVSGRGLHIREGVVVSPFRPRASSEGFMLFVKVINPAYKDDPEAFS
jgi:RNA ligase (TIGR02306 family)